jgi:aspartate/methionine/tyrosine aminotransferase
LVLSGGCTALLYALSYVLFNDDESILIPTPYYPAFDYDFTNIGKVTIVPVLPDVDSITHLLSSTISLTSLNVALEASFAQNKRPKAIILTNPHNPMGTVYSKENLLAIVQWCRQHRIHFISDEIYALSVFNESPDSKFVRIASVLDNQLNDDVHILWGLSKDFGLSGFRVGVFYSHNTQLLQAMGRMADPLSASHFTQEISGYILSDQTFLDFYILEN